MSAGVGESVTGGGNSVAVLTGDSKLASVIPDVNAQRRHMALIGEEGDINSLASMNC